MGPVSTPIARSGSSLGIAGDASVELAAGGGSSRVIHTQSLSLAGTAKLDLGDNKLITASPGVGSASGGVYNGVSGLIQSGRNGGAWNGSGIVTSQTDATSGTLTSIGVATAQQIKGLTTATDTAVWAGQTVSGSETLVMYTYGGDANLDGKLNVDDYVRIDSNVGLNNTTAAWFNGDFNYDGTVDVDDYVIIDSNAGLAQPPFPAGSGAGGLNVVAIPEPSAAGAGLLVWALAAGGRHGRRRRASVSNGRPQLPHRDVMRESGRGRSKCLIMKPGH